MKKIHTIKSRLSCPRQIFVCDQYKGQNETVKAWYPEVQREDFLFHLKEDMQKQENGSA